MSGKNGYLKIQAKLKELKINSIKDIQKLSMNRGKEVSKVAMYFFKYLFIILTSSEHIKDTEIKVIAKNLRHLQNV